METTSKLDIFNLSHKWIEMIRKTKQNFLIIYWSEQLNESFIL